jgi:serine/threonine-protein kinase
MDTATYERLPSQPPGTILGDSYRVVRRVGFGGMGEVYEATHVRLPGRFAVKILLPDLLANPEAFARFCREAEIMSELRHPNIVQIFDFNAAADGRPYFVMEYLDGRDLEARLAEAGQLPLPTTVRIVGAVASALAAAHAHGVVHRDLKPANIFLGAVDGQADQLVKVLDFGISQVRSAADRRLSQPHHVLGTPPYMAPEQVRGARDAVDGRADQFALGAIAYRMLTGCDAFRGEDTPALLYHIVHESAAPLADHLPSNWDSRPLQAVLDRALAKQPEQRWGGMMELARAFEDAAERTISDATPAPPLTPKRPPGISDEPPPIRLPDLPRPPAPALVSTRPRPVRERPPAAPATAGWEPSSSVDKIPMTRVRAATLGLVALALGGVLLATGGARQLPAALPFARDNLRSWVSQPPALEQPRADQSVPRVVARAQAKSAEAAAAEVARANGAAPAAAAVPEKRPAERPPRPAKRPAHPAKQPLAAASPKPVPPPPAAAPPAEPASRPSLAGTPPEPPPLPTPASPAAPGPLTAPPPGGFSIPAPAEQAPARDLAPLDPEGSAPPARANAEAPTSATTPAPAPAADDPLPRPRSNTEAPTPPPAP